MSNPYVNQVLFGHSKRSVTKEYVDGLLPNMLTTEWISSQFTARSPTSNVPFIPEIVEPIKKLPKMEVDSLTYEDESSTLLRRDAVNTLRDHSAPYAPISEAKSASERRSGLAPAPIITNQSNNIKFVEPKCISDHLVKKNPSGNTLFWSIYSAMNPAEAFLQRSAANVEIETRIKIVESLRKTPKRLKDTNAKLTIDATQGLLGAMLTAREDRIDFCVAYSVFYNKHILIVYPKTCRLFSPNTTVDIEDDDHTIILYASKPGSKIVYSLEPNPTREMAVDFLNKRPAELKAQSNYKTPELESIAETFDIATRTAEGKRRKKEDIYNDIRTTIHNDVNFV